MILNVTGPDASGKDAQIQQLSEWLRLEYGLKVKVISVWDSLQIFESIKDDSVLGELLSGFLLRFEPVPRSLFLAATLLNSYELALAKPADLYIVNGGFEKYAASEMAYGVPATLWGWLQSQFPLSDLTVFLDVELHACLQRREKWTPYEQGAAKFHNQPAKSLLKFQSMMHQNLRQLCRRENTVNIKAERTVREVFDDIKAVVRRSLKKPNVARDADLL